MPYFPQLPSGASSHYPVRKLRETRTISNARLDGGWLKLADADAAQAEWQLSFQELTDPELALLEQFFTSMEARLGSFTFLDPSDNLLAWSEKLDQAVWTATPTLGVAGAIADPLGTTRAFRLTNASAAALRIQQTLPAPVWYSYTFSLYARADQSGTITLIRDVVSAGRAVSPQWKRLVLAGQSSGTAESISFGLELAPGTSVDVFGLQVEAQIGASTYKMTGASGGVYLRARFSDDRFTSTTTGPGRHACQLRVTHGNHF